MMRIYDPRRIPKHPVIKLIIFPHKTVRAYLDNNIRVQINRIRIIWCPGCFLIDVVRQRLIGRGFLFVLIAGR